VPVVTQAVPHTYAHNAAYASSLQNLDVAAAAIGPRGDPIPTPATRSSNKRQALVASARPMLASLPAAAGQPVTATNVYGKTCSVDQILMPSTTQELAAALQQLHSSNYNYTIRTTHR
jgi:hypothetical protein